jgi:diacylglycerol kinase
MKNISLRLRMKSFADARKGITTALKTELHLRVHVLAAVLVVLAGWLLHISSTEWMFVLICMGGVITAELFNTAIEKLVDLVSPEYNKQAGFIKDVAAGAVLVNAIIAALVGLFIFIPKLIALLP